MKHLIIPTIITAISATTAGAEQLLPYFLELVGNDYTTMDSGFTHYVGKNNDSNYDQAISFIDKTVPETSGMIVDENTFGKQHVRAYSTTLDNGDVSVIYIIRNSDNTLSIEYAEGPFISLLPFYR